MALIKAGLHLLSLNDDLSLPHSHNACHAYRFYEQDLDAQWQ